MEGATPPAYVQRFYLQVLPQEQGATTLRAKVPSEVGHMLWSYYDRPERTRLYIGAEIDGVGTELFRVFPKDPKLTADVAIDQGPRAPSRDTGLWDVDLEEQYLTDYNQMPGSQWVYRVRETGLPDKTMAIRLTWRDGEERWFGDAEIWEDGVFKEEAYLLEDPRFAFMTRLFGMGMVYQLPSEEPDTLHYAYTTRREAFGGFFEAPDPWAGAQREVWFKPSVGVTRLKDVRLRPTPYGPVRETRELELLSSPPPPAPNPYS
ncbi:hypothetical protein D3C86_1296420 [compost metagenome]